MLFIATKLIDLTFCIAAVAVVAFVFILIAFMLLRCRMQTVITFDAALLLLSHVWHHGRLHFA